MNTDPISDLLTRIRNSSRAHHQKVNVPHSKLKESIVKVMKEKDFIEEYKIGNDTKNFKILTITLKETRSNITLKRISTPGQRIYTKKGDIKTIKSGLGVQIISTSKGVMTNIDAKKQNIGGEILCEIY